MLRRALGEPPVIVSGNGGYLLAVDPSQVDALAALDQTTAAARMLDAGDAAGAVDPCTSTLKLFRGGVLPGAGDGEWVDPHRARLEEAQQTGSIDDVDFITAGVVVMTVVSGIAYAALRLSTDLQKGIISRFRTMPVAPSSVLSGQALSSTLSNLFSCFLVVMVAFLVGFRPDADATAWLSFVGLLVLFILATTWLAMLFGLLAKTPCRCRCVQLHPAAADLHQPLVRTHRLDVARAEGFAENQPMTPMVETVRSLLTEGTPGPDVWSALAWATGILVVSYALALRTYRRSAPHPAAA